MLSQSAFQVLPRLRPLGSENLRRPLCPRCGSVQLIAEESSFYNAERRIDHAWSCDDCGNRFITTVALARR